MTTSYFGKCKVHIWQSNSVHEYFERENTPNLFMSLVAYITPVGLYLHLQITRNWRFVVI